MCECVRVQERVCERSRECVRARVCASERESEIEVDIADEQRRFQSNSLRGLTLRDGALGTTSRNERLMLWHKRLQ